MTVVVFSLGANLGDRLRQLQAAVDGLGAHRVSGVYETPPWGDPDQPAYLNAVAIAADHTRGPCDWLELARSLESQVGRVRDPDRRYGPRPLDVDLIHMRTDTGQPIVSDDPELTLPHPRARWRAFVLVPWLELEPEATVPGAGRAKDLLTHPDVVDDAPGVRLRDDLRLRPVADFTR